jgi:hypothetical protein
MLIIPSASACDVPWHFPIYALALIMSYSADLLGILAAKIAGRRTTECRPAQRRPLAVV